MVFASSTHGVALAALPQHHRAPHLLTTRCYRTPPLALRLCRRSAAQRLSSRSAHGPPQRHRLAALQPSAPAEHQGSAPGGGSAPASPRGIFARVLAWWRQWDRIDKFVLAGRVFIAVFQVSFLAFSFCLLCWSSLGQLIWTAGAVYTLWGWL